MLQQYLPFTVLKPALINFLISRSYPVATVLTVYGIETYLADFAAQRNRELQQYLPFTVLKLWNISI